MNANATTISASAPSAIAGFLQALRGCWYLTWKSKLSRRSLPAVLVTVLAVPILAFSTTDESRRSAYFHWFVGFHLQLTLPFYCLTVFGDLIREELQANTLHFLSTRPVTRSQLFLGKFISQMVWVQILAAATACCFVLVGWLKGISGAVSLAGVFLVTQFFAVLAFGALASLFGLLNKRYLVLGTLYGIVVEVGIAQIPTNINSLAITHHLRTLLAHSSVVRDLYEWSPAETKLALLCLGAGTVLYLGVATTLFTFLEFHASEEMQK